MSRRKHSINSVPHYPRFRSKMMGAFLHEGNQPWILFSHHDPVYFLPLLIGRGKGRMPPLCSWPMAGITTFPSFHIYVLFFNLFLFNWRIITLPCSLVSAIYQHELAIGIHMSPPSGHLPPFPTPLGCYRAPVWVSQVIQQISTGYLKVLYMLPYYSLHSSPPPPPPPVPMSWSLFFISANPLMPWKYVRQYRLSRFHVCNFTYMYCLPTCARHSDRL